MTEPVRFAHTGLSPRVRGSLHASMMTVYARVRVYPRVCGGASMSDNTSGRGSAHGVYPRVCGGAACSVRYFTRCDYGSIPACAGEPDHLKTSCVAIVMSGVYPRVCGGAATARPAIPFL